MSEEDKENLEKQLEHLKALIDFAAFIILSPMRDKALHVLPPWRFGVGVWGYF